MAYNKALEGFPPLMPGPVIPPVMMSALPKLPSVTEEDLGRMTPTEMDAYFKPLFDEFEKMMKKRT